MTEIAPFLGLTFGISMAAFVGIAKVPGAHSPESPRGLPFWLLAVWGPSLAAMILAARDGAFAALLWRAVALRGVPLPVWLLAASPLLALAWAVLRAGLPKRANLTPALIVKLTAFNLILGPLGEEFGWRGVMQPALEAPLGWVGASLVVGAVWWLWHLPLWLVESPQRQIPIPLFGAHCLSYAVILGAMTHLTGSLAPAILFHLGVNVVAGLAEIGGAGDTRRVYALMLWPYAALAAALCLVM